MVAAQKFGAGELAWCLMVMCSTGIELRQQGWCLGDLRPAEISVSGHDLVFTKLGSRRTEASAALRRHAAHLNRGHGAACRAVGVSRSAVERVLTAWDDVGATGLLLEAFDSAVAELRFDGSHGEWASSRAREAIAHAVRVRITPRSPESRSDPRGPRTTTDTATGRGFAEEAPGP